MNAGPWESHVVLSGVGQSRVTRRSDASNLGLTLDAVTAAVADAGLDVHDLDGVATIAVPAMTLNTPGTEGPDADELIEALGIRARWALTTSGGTHPFVEAARAIADGTCRHVVAFRTVKNGSASRGPEREHRGADWGAASGAMAWQVPVGAFSTANLVAMSVRRYMGRTGLTREQMGWLPVVQRAHAGANPDAVYRDPLSLDDYLAGRMISDPLTIFDCDVPVDASTAIVFSTAGAASSLRAPVRIDALAWSVSRRGHFDLLEDRLDERMQDTARALWARSSCSSGDIDVAQLYDGHSWFALAWLAALGFCAADEIGSFVDGGYAITHGGAIPVNTWGGQLSAGRVHAGFGHLVEGVRQVRGEAGDRQVRGARNALVTAGTGSPALVLTEI